MLLLTSSAITTSIPFRGILSALPGLRRFATATTPNINAKENTMNLAANNRDEKFFISCFTSFLSPIFLIVLFFHRNKRKKRRIKIATAVNNQKNSGY